VTAKSGINCRDSGAIKVCYHQKRCDFASIASLNTVDIHSLAAKNATWAHPPYCGVTALKGQHSDKVPKPDRRRTGINLNENPWRRLRQLGVARKQKNKTLLMVYHWLISGG
jgi:hypothetical protein